jgi:predicted enzyme related to lactoylglutathione lyase
MTSVFQGLRTTIYYVTDVIAAKNWYSTVLGVAPYFDEPFYVGFNIGGFELGLHPIREQQNNTQGVSTYWGVDDVQKVFAMLVDAGATPHEAPQNVGGDIMVATVLDPWGNKLGIIYNPEFKISE